MVFERRKQIFEMKIVKYFLRDFLHCCKEKKMDIQNKLGLLKSNLFFFLRLLSHLMKYLQIKLSGKKFVIFKNFIDTDNLNKSLKKYQLKSNHIINEF